MNTPPLLVGAALLFWGWQTGYFVAGALVGALLELARVVPVRWSFSKQDFDRLWNITTVLVVGAAIYLVINEGTVSLNDFFENAGRRPEAIREQARAALLWFQWFPMLFLPFMAAVALSAEKCVDLATFSWFLRRRRDASLPVDRINVTYPFFGVTLLAATATNNRSPVFYFGLAALVAWALWTQRSRRCSAAAWIGLFGIVLASGYFGHLGLSRLHRVLEQLNVTWFFHSGALGFDAKGVRTAIGSVGRLKMSDRIVLRVRTDGDSPPDLLREASYSVYRGGLWSVTDKEFGGVDSETNKTSWILLPDNTASRIATIGKYVTRGETILPLPSGTAELHDLRAELLETNRLASARVGGAPGVITYRAHYGARRADSAPADDDLRVTEAEDAVLTQIASELGLNETLAVKDAMRRVAAYFAANFNYSIYRGTSHRATSNQTALARFLVHTRAGHCEYFATATTLLLRKAGIPTRYAVGYAVQEGSGDRFVVRERHAHAWTLVFDGRRWIDFDTTPGSWNAIEAKRASALLPLKDFFSDIWFQFSKWRWSNTDWRKYLMWTPAPVLAAAVLTFVLKKQWRQIKPARRGRKARRDQPGLDSELYDLERRLASRGLKRLPSENWSAWARRANGNGPATQAFHESIRLHCKYRFDPLGLSKSEREALRQSVRDCLTAAKR